MKTIKLSTWRSWPVVMAPTPTRACVRSDEQGNFWLCVHVGKRVEITRFPKSKPANINLGKTP